MLIVAFNRSCRGSSWSAISSGWKFSFIEGNGIRVLYDHHHSDLTIMVNGRLQTTLRTTKLGKRKGEMPLAVLIHWPSLSVVSIIEIVVRDIEGFGIGWYMFRGKVSNIGQKGDKGSECGGRPLGVSLWLEEGSAVMMVLRTVSTDTLVYGFLRYAVMVRATWTRLELPSKSSYSLWWWFSRRYWLTIALISWREIHIPKTVLTVVLAGPDYSIAPLVVKHFGSVRWTTMP